MAAELYFDARSLQDSHYGTNGVGIYSRFLLSGLLQAAAFKVSLVVDPRLPTLAAGDELLSDLPVVGYAAITAGIYLSPSFMTHYPVPMLQARRNGVKAVGVIHDLIPLRGAPGNDDGIRTGFLALLKMTDMLSLAVCNSEATAQDYISYFDRHPPVTVVHPASRLSAERTLTNSEMRNVDYLLRNNKFVFYATADDRRKNIGLAARAERDMMRLGLKSVIGGGIGEHARQHINSAYGANGLLFMPRLTDNELAHVYSRSAVVVVPSFDEGFSLPVLEAAQLGCRVVASDIAAHREQVSDSRILFDPQSVDSLMQSIAFALATRDKPYRIFDHARELNQLTERLLDLL